MKWLFYISSMFVLAACQTPHYFPSMGTAPLHTESNEGVMMLGVNSSGISPVLSYSVNDFLSVSASGSFLEHDDLSFGFAEAGVSYYQSKNEMLNYSFSLFPGYGWSDFKTNHPDFPGESYVNYYKISVQPTIGLTTDYFDMYLNIRMAFLDFFQVHTTHDPKTGMDLFIEPSLGIQVGYKYIKLFLQAQISTPVMKNSDISYFPMHISIGLRSKIPFGENN